MLNLILKKLKLVKQAEHDKILKINKGLQESNAELVKKLANTKPHLKRLNAIQSDLDALNSTNKKLHKNVKRLLSRKKELKEQIETLEIKVLFWESYANTLSDRLEHLCFGSMLPRVMRKSNIHNYQHLFKPVDIEYHLTKSGHYQAIVNVGEQDEPRK